MRDTPTVATQGCQNASCPRSSTDARPLSNDRMMLRIQPKATSENTEVARRHTLVLNTSVPQLVGSPLASSAGAYILSRILPPVKGWGNQILSNIIQGNW